MTCELTVHRPSDTLPQTATEDLFAVSGGLVRITRILGRVTVAIQNQSNASSVGALASLGGSLTNLSGTVSLSDLPAGGPIGVPLSGNPFVVEAIGPTVIMGDGDIRLTCAASNTGEVEWWLSYEPLTPGAVVEVA